MLKTIYIMSSSGVILDHLGFFEGVEALRHLGYTVLVDENALSQYYRFAGTDEDRANAFCRAIDSQADLVLFSRGGYGLTRILDQLPWERIIEAGQKWVGFSDITAFQLGALKKGFSTYAGPMLMTDFFLPRLNNQSFLEVMKTESIPEIAFSTEYRESLNMKGRLWGGNLAMVLSLLGTPWWYEIENGLLFLEDVGEEPYQVERMLWQLHQAGVLNRQQAILLGDFSGYQLTESDGQYNIKEVVSYIRSLTSTPIITGLPFGHSENRVLLKQGGEYRLHVSQENALLSYLK